MTEPYANIRHALEAIQASARGHRHKRDLAHLDFREACDPDTIRELLAERDQLAAALEAVQMGFRYAVRVWVLTDEIVLSEKKIDEVIESIIGDAKKEAGND